jgi:hypothetical protein
MKSRHTVVKARHRVKGIFHGRESLTAKMPEMPRPTAPDTESQIPLCVFHLTWFSGIWILGLFGAPTVVPLVPRFTRMVAKTLARRPLTL